LTIFNSSTSVKRRIISLFQFFCVSLSIINQNIIIKMKNGIVKFFNETKGFGFIKANDSDEEFFVHVSGLKEEIRQNDEVLFEVQEGKKGLNAVNVRLA
jgi:CspA family cold shock protein